MEIALQKAIQVKDVELVRALIDTCLIDLKQLTARFLGKNGTPELVAILVEKGCDLTNLNVVTDSIESLLYYACAYNNAPLVEYLIENGFNPFEQIETHNQTYVEFFGKNRVLAPIINLAVGKMQAKNDFYKVLEELGLMHWKKKFDSVIDEFNNIVSSGVTEMYRYQWSQVMEQIKLNQEYMNYHWVIRDIPDAYNKFMTKKIINELTKTKIETESKPAYVYSGYRVECLKRSVRGHLFESVMRQIEQYQQHKLQCSLMAELRNYFIQVDHQKLMNEIRVMGEYRVWKDLMISIRENYIITQRKKFINEIVKVAVAREINKIIVEINKSAWNFRVSSLNREVVLRFEDKLAKQKIAEDKIEAELRSEYTVAWVNVMKELKNYNLNKEWNEIMDRLEAYQVGIRWENLMKELITTVNNKEQRRSAWNKVMGQIKNRYIISLWNKSLYAKEKLNDEFISMIKKQKHRALMMELVCAVIQKNFEEIKKDYMKEQFNIVLNDLVKTNNTYIPLPFNFDLPPYPYDNVVNELNMRQQIILEHFAMSMSEEVPNIEEAKSELKHGFNCTQEDSHGCQPIHWASCFGDVDMVSYIMSFGADVNTICHHEDGSITPLIFASMWNNLDVADYLMKNGADIDFVSEDGRTALLESSSDEMTALIEKYIFKNNGICFDPKNYAPFSEQFFLEWNNTEEYNKKSWRLVEKRIEINNLKHHMWVHILDNKNKSTFEKWYKILDCEHSQMCTLDKEMKHMFNSCIQTLKMTEDVVEDVIEDKLIKSNKKKTDKKKSNKKKSDKKTNDKIGTISINIDGGTDELLRILQAIRDAL
jgi:hypothetical protein